MQTSILYQKISNEISEQLVGDITLKDGVIVWCFSVDLNVGVVDEKGISEEDVEIFCVEEKLNEAYLTDLKTIKNFLFYNDTDGLFELTNSVKYNKSICFEIRKKMT